MEKSNCVTNKKSIELKGFSEIINKYDYYIFDMDGVFWNGEQIIDSAIETIKHLLKIGKKFYFLTNANTKTRKDILEKLIKCGLNELNENHINLILNSSYILAKYIKKNHPEIKKIYLVGSQELEEELTNLGFEVLGGIRDSEKKLKYTEVDNFIIDESIDCCVCGHDDGINFYKMTYATHVINKTKKFFGTNTDTKSLRNDKIIPGTYGIICMFEKFTDLEAKIVTKPNPISLDIIMKSHNLEGENKNKFLMIGDNPNTDIQFANNCGIDSLMLFSGITTKEQLQNYEDNFEKYFNPEKNIFPTYFLEKLKL